MNFAVASTVEGTDKALYFTIAISAFFLISITAVMIFFVFRYSRKRNPVSGHITGNTWLETAWTVIPTLLVLMMFWYGYVGYEAVRNMPAGSFEIQVQARRWAWNFEYPNKKQSQVLYVPVGSPINLTMTSRDVIHSFYVPAFRFKYDVVPGSVHHITFTPLEAGTFDIFCAEYCGTGHSAMGSSVVVMPPREFSAWYTKAAEQRPINVREAIKPSPAQVQRGKDVYLTYCVTCHGPTGRGENLPGARNFTSLAGWKRGPQTPRMFQTVTEGLGNNMPAFPNLPVEDRLAAIQYVHQTFMNGKAPEPTPAEIAEMDRKYNLSKGALPPPELPVDQAMKRLASESSVTLQSMEVQPATQEEISAFQQAGRKYAAGAGIYSANCAGCHGEWAQGQIGSFMAGGLRSTSMDSPALNNPRAPWQAGPDDLRRRVQETSIATGGWKPAFTTLSANEWQSLSQFLKAIVAADSETTDAAK